MKNKKLNIILIVGVAVIWSIIIFRITNKAEQASYAVEPYRHDNTTKIKEFSISLDYEDPFRIDNVENIKLHKSKVIANVKPEKQKKISDLNYIDTIKIKYKGIINSRDNIAIGIIELNNKDILVKEKDLINGYYIVKLETNALTVKMNDKTHLIFK